MKETHNNRNLHNHFREKKRTESEAEGMTITTNDSNLQDVTTKLAFKEFAWFSQTESVPKRPYPNLIVFKTWQEHLSFTMILHKFPDIYVHPHKLWGWRASLMRGESDVLSSFP